jgi:RNA polymerase sigma-32 factor
MAQFDSSYTHQANRDYVRNAMSMPMLEKDRELNLARAWRDNRDERAMQEIINSYRRLVISMAGKFKHYGLPMADLVQEGNIGLMEAMNRFDPERDLRFSTYASWWVRSTMQDYVLRNWSIVRTGTTSAQKSLFFNLRRLKARIANDSGHGFLNNENVTKIATDMGIHERDVRDMEMRLNTGDQSLNLQIGDDGETELQSLFASDAPNPEDLVIEMRTDEKRTAWLKEALSELNDRERQIISQRHLGYDQITLDALGKSMGVSKERVRQIEERAMSKLRTSMRGRIKNGSDLFTGH